MKPLFRQHTEIYSFSGIYEEQSFWRKLPASAGDFRFFDLTHLSGTNGYLSEEAKAEICELFTATGGIHYIDSGNTHYMTGLLTARIDEPFRLLLFDHHPDMQKPAFGSLLSCGSWLRSAIEENRNLRSVVMAGVDEVLAGQVMEADGGKWEIDGKTGLWQGSWQDRPLTRIPTDILETAESGKLLAYLSGDGLLPLYLSIDKDVFSADEVRTNWDQGSLSTEGFFRVLRALCEGETPILGVDICGECDRRAGSEDYRRALMQNDFFNGRIYSILCGGEA